MFKTLAFGALLISGCSSVPKPHREVVIHPSLKITGNELPMMGKWSVAKKNLATPGDPYVWITRVKSAVIDEKTNKPNEDLICHGHVWESHKAYDQDNRRFLGTHGGTSELTLPPGFAVKFESSPEKPLGFYGMSADYAKRGIPESVHFETTIDYYSTEEARKLDLKELEFQFVYLKAPEHNHGYHADNHFHSHWFFPPGKSEVAADITDQLSGIADADYHVHHIHLHVHPYQEWGEIYDATEKKTVFRGKAVTFPDRSVLESVEKFSSATPIIMKRGHRYELRTGVNNPTPKDISGMVTVRILHRKVR